MSSDSDDPDAFTGTLLRADRLVDAMRIDEVGPRDEGKITVQFKTFLPREFVVAETPFEVPSEFARLGLSELINHLLGRGEGQKVPFDFLIDGHFLRSSLRVWRISQLAERSVVTIEYVKAVVTPNERVDSLHRDWIKCIASSAGGQFATGSFDGSVRLIDAKGREVALAASVLPRNREVWALQFLSEHALLVGGKSCTATLLHSLGRAMQPLLSVVVSSQVTCLSALNPDKCVLGCASGALYFFELPEGGGGEEAAESRAKRARGPDELRDPALSLRGHAEAVTAVRWGEPGRLLSAGMDHFAKLWDVDSNVATSQFACNKSVTAADWSVPNSVVVTGGADGVVGLWDVRTGAGEQRRFKSHTGWISSLKFGSSHLFLSGSYDNSVKLWDVRASVPLFTVSGEGTAADKVFDVAWNNGDLDIAFGGTQKKLVICPGALKQRV